MKLLKKLFSRFFFVALTIVVLFALEFAGMIAVVWFLSALIVSKFPGTEVYITVGVNAVAWIIVIVTVLHAANRDMVPETKIPWILCIIAFNVFGVALYVTFSSRRPSRRRRRLFAELSKEIRPYEKEEVDRDTLRAEMGQWASVSEALSTVNPAAIVHGGNKTEYFPSGESFFARLKEDLEGAEKYIFLEYFILEKGVFWNALLDILERKAKEGVEVRVMYDDIGNMGRVRANYHKKLQKMGIECVKFNPFVPVVTNAHNNRDHRKIAVIDGKVAYTGGINLADEYINATHPFGHWKDTAVRIEGSAVRNFVLLFLGLYGITRRAGVEVKPYLPETYEFFEGEGYVQPFGDGPSPLYSRHLSEDVYINILNGAKKYVYITTPYLIIDYRMREALVLAAQRGVDVRVVTPHIPDKKIAFALTRSNYMALIRAGVHVYEYTPGFIHAKSFLADGEVGVVGTVNLDYRSFLFHFEDAVFMYKTAALEGLKADFESIFESSALQTEEDAKRNVVFRWICEIAKIFAPLF